MTITKALSRSVLLAVLGLLPLAAWTLSPAPPLPKEELVAFYAATNGDEWVNNTGWLSDGVPICDWYGVICDSISEVEFVNGLKLPDNGLTGTIDGLAILDYPLQTLDLSGNALTGGLAQLPVQISLVNLARNQLGGPLPIRLSPVDEIPDPTPPALTVLDLSGNAFSGAVPDDWAGLELGVLDLSNNRLDAAIENAFLAIGDARRGELYLQDNRFRGGLPVEVTTTRLWETDLPLSGGGLNLCWNALTIDDPDLTDFVDRHHVAGPGWVDCLNRERVAIDPTISGSWFSPERSGEGFSLMLMDNGQPLIYSFTYTPEGEQLWYFEVGRSGELFLDWPNLFETRGDFGLGLRWADGIPALRETARLRIDRIGSESIHVERSVIDYSGCPAFDGLPPGDDDPVPLPCPISPISDRSVQIQLTRLAGTSCDNQDPHQWISGAWFSPDRAGEGFVVEVFENGRGLVYWFTYTADGSGRPLWLTADARFENDRLELDSLLRPVGVQAGRTFDNSELILQDWGSLSLSFDAQQDTGLARFDAFDPSFGGGEFTLKRLARPMLAECD
jgi:hypothetical protein